ncbi:MAG: ParB/RepB/Spo0J family partition protein [Oscillospiraceae bacterium]
MKKKGGLGRGFDILFDDNVTEQSNSAQTLRISEIEPNKNQPRMNFDEEALESLAESIRQHGVLQPILVRPYKDAYQIVAGERRWRACRMNGMTEIPVYIIDMNDAEVAQVAIIENLQREDLNPIEEAQGYKDLIERYGMSQDDVAKTVGKARSSITNALRLLSLEDDVREMLIDGSITRGHAKALLSIEDSDRQKMLAKQAAEGNLTVRAIERASQLQGKTPQRRSVRRIDSFYTEMQLALTEALGKKVKINKEGKKITLQIECATQDELKDLAEKLTK